MSRSVVEPAVHYAESLHDSDAVGRSQDTIVLFKQSRQFIQPGSTQEFGAARHNCAL